MKQEKDLVLNHQNVDALSLAWNTNVSPITTATKEAFLVIYVCMFIMITEKGKVKSN